MKQVTFVFTTRANQDFSDTPCFAYFKVTQSFIDWAKKLHSILIENSLTELRTASGPEYQNEDEYRLDSHELVITKDSIWFTCFSKHTDIEVETTRSPSVEKYQSLFDDAENDDVIYLGADGEEDAALEWYEEAFAAFDT